MKCFKVHSCAKKYISIEQSGSTWKQVSVHILCSSAPGSGNSANKNNTKEGKLCPIKCVTNVYRCLVWCLVWGFDRRVEWIMCGRYTWSSLKNTREFVATWENGYGFKMWKICRPLSNTRACMWLNTEGSTRKWRGVRMTVLDHFSFFLFEDFLNCGSFFKVFAEFLNLLQYCFYSVFGFLTLTHLHPPALEGEVLTPGWPREPQDHFNLSKLSLIFSLFKLIEKLLGQHGREFRMKEN